MRTEIKNYLAQNFDNNGNHALKNVVLHYFKMNSNNCRRSFWFKVNYNSNTWKELSPIINNEKLLQKYVNRAFKKTSITGKFSWKKVKTEDLDKVIEVAKSVDYLLGLTYKRIKENEKLKSISEDFV